MIGKPEIAIKARAIIGEGPVWDRQDELLYWVDIAGKNVFISDLRAGTSRSVNVKQFVGSLAVRNSDELIVALRDGFFLLNKHSEKIVPIASPENSPRGNRFNDGKCDGRGRFWAGTQPTDENGNATEARGVAALYCLDLDQTLSKKINDVSISNGIAWSSDNETMYYIDSRIMAVAAFDFHLETGELSNRRYVIEIPPGHGSPDGMTIDDEGMLYIAEWDGYQVSKWNPRTGKCIDKIRFPIAKITSCAFGGEKLDELYVTTACIGSRPGDATESAAGSLFRIRMDISGAESHRYAG